MQSVAPAKGFESYFLHFSSGARLGLIYRANIPPTQDDPLIQFTGYIYLAITAGSEAPVDALTARLTADGYPVLDGPCWAGDGYYESVVLDPDGSRIELAG